MMGLSKYSAANKPAAARHPITPMMLNTGTINDSKESTTAAPQQIMLGK